MLQWRVIHIFPTVSPFIYQAPLGTARAQSWRLNKRWCTSSTACKNQTGTGFPCQKVWCMFILTSFIFWYVPLFDIYFCFTWQPSWWLRGRWIQYYQVHTCCNLSCTAWSVSTNHLHFWFYILCTCSHFHHLFYSFIYSKLSAKPLGIKLCSYKSCSAPATKKLAHSRSFKIIYCDKHAAEQLTETFVDIA